jgi:hypothetical protein
MRQNSNDVFEDKPFRTKVVDNQHIVFGQRIAWVTFREIPKWSDGREALARWPTNNDIDIPGQAVQHPKRMSANIPRNPGRVLMVSDERLDAVRQQVNAARCHKATGLFEPEREATRTAENIKHSTGAFWRFDSSWDDFSLTCVSGCVSLARRRALSMMLLLSQ